MLTEADFQAIISSPDVVVISIRGQIAIESALVEVIAKGLPEPHHLEVARLTYPFKVDLAVALKGLRSEARPLFLKLNSIRNKFAHSPTAQLDETSIQEIKSCMADHQRNMVGSHFDAARNPRYALLMATTAAFYEAMSGADRLYKKRLHQDAWLEEVRELIDSIDPNREINVNGDFSQKLEARIQKKLQGKP